MFAKLLKHEIKSTGGLLGLMSLGALVVGVIGGFLLRFIMNEEGVMDAYEVLYIVASIALPVIFLTLIAYAVGGEIYLLVQFYKRKFTDEGYLTFTLPVRSWQIYLSSLLNMMLWTFIITVVMFTAFATIFLIGMYNTQVWQELMRAPIDIRGELDLMMDEFGGYSILYGILNFVSSNVMMLSSVVLGSVIAKKRKVLGAIGAYYGMSMIMTAVNTWISGMFLDLSNPSVDTVVLTSGLVCLVCAISSSVLSIWLMDKKLNLP